MLKKTHLAILGLIILLAASLFAQNFGTISDDALASNGFSFADQSRPMCKITGPDGPCRVEAFVAGETTKDDKARYTCKKLDRATYVGNCSNGKLEGLSLVIADGSKKLSKEAYISYVHEGRIAYPALTSWLTGNGNFGVEEKRRSYGCVYFGKWDKSSERCALFIQIYGKDLFTDSNAQKLRDGTFELDKYRAEFLDFMRRKQ